jgi:transcriptional regulator with GAF, ATPase, and Fis domain
MAGVARDLSEIARDLQAEDGSDAVMHHITGAALTEIAGAVGSAITIFERGKVTSAAPTDERARRVGEAQERTGEGPCVDSARQEVTLRSDDLREDQRWPRWGAEAVAEGVLSVLSFQLFVEEDNMGALDIYGDHPHAFSAEAENTGLLLASHAAIAMSDTRKIENLKVALISRDVIGQAKGILMERYKISPIQAFDLLIKSSQMTHRKLHVIADQLAATGELPLPPAPGR